MDRQRITYLHFQHWRVKEQSGDTNCQFGEYDTGGNEFRDYEKNWVKITGVMNVRLELNGWRTAARTRVVGNNRPSIIGRDLMEILGV